MRNAMTSRSAARLRIQLGDHTAADRHAVELGLAGGVLIDRVDDVVAVGADREGQELTLRSEQRVRQPHRRQLPETGTLQMSPAPSITASCR
jgi:hypothetical protein